MTAVTHRTGESSGNPAFNERIESHYLVARSGESATMTRAGVAGKTLINLAVLVAGGAWGWASATTPVGHDIGQGYGNATVTVPGGFWLVSIVAFFVGMFCSFSPRSSVFLGVAYATLEGYVLGAVSAMFDAQANGVVGAAVLGTVCVFAVAWVLYASGLIRPTARLAFAVTAGMGGLMLLYLVAWLASLFDWSWQFTQTFTMLGVVVTLVAVGLAAMNLVLDFGQADAGVAAGAPKYMESYCAYGLMVTLIWLYTLLLRFLALTGAADRN